MRSQARYLELNCRSSTQTCTPHKKGQPSKQHAAMGVQVAPVAVAEATDIETGQGVPPACPFKEATLELRDSRILELRSMMHRGAEYAQAAVLRAGYFGGESRLAIAGWSFAGCLLVLYSIQLLYSALRGGSDYAWAMKTRGYVAALCLAAITSLVLGVAVLIRVFCLRDRRRRAAHYAMIFIALWLGGMGMVVHVMYIFTDSFAKPRPILLYLDLLSNLCNLVCRACLLGFGTATFEGDHGRASLRLIFAGGVCVLYMGFWFAVSRLQRDPAATQAGVFFVMCLGVLATLYLIHLRRRTRRNADRIVARDRDRYDALWKDLAAAAPFLAKLDALEAAVARSKQVRVEPKSVRARAFAKLEQLREITGTAKPRQFIDDLAVLLAQAAALNTHFQGLVAARAKGGKHRPGSVKSRARAIEKLYRSYGGDASRLIDLVRTIVVFDDIDGVVAFVEALCDDPALAVVGSKNALSATFDSRENAGYRNINLSVLVVDSLAFSQGLDAHVCELQLGIAPIEALRNEEGHANYIKWRDINAE